MKPYKLIHETPDHFVMHNGQAHFHVAKSGIDQPTSDKIRSMSEGGLSQSPQEAGIEAEEKTRRAQSKQSPEEKQIEADAQKPVEDYVKYNNPDKFSEGGKLDASARAHISSKNFAGPDRSYPIEDASHARNALARVSQHGSPELKAQVRSKVHAKYPGIEQAKADGGEVESPAKKSSVADDFDMYAHKMDVTSDKEREKYQNIKQLSQETGLPKFADGGEPDQSGLWESLKKAFNTPAPPSQESDKNAEYEKIRAKNTENMQTGDYAMGGDITNPAKVHSTSNESQSEAIRRYADGNPANMSKGGHIHNNGGKNQLHFHFYDGASVPSPLDKYVGGEPNPGPSPTSLDNYVKMAEGGDPAEPSDSQKLQQASQDVQSGLESQKSGSEDSSSVSDNATQQPVASNDTTTQAPIPQAQQISAQPKPLPPTPDQQPNMLSDFDKSLAMQKQGIEAGAAAQTQGYQETAKAIGENVLQEKARQDAYKVEADKITQQNQQLFNAVASSKVDPNHFWNSKSTGGKISAAIGVLLGGIAGGANGTNQNQVFANLQNQIQQDIEAQKNDQSNKMNLYKMGLERYRDAQSAQQFATLQSNALLQGTLQKIAAQTGAPQAQATAQQMIGQLGVQNAGIRADLAMKSAAMQTMNQPQAQAGVDPNKLRLLINSGVIPKEEVPTAMKEYGDYEKLGTVLDDTDKTFDIGRKNANWRQAALPHWTPNITQASKQYDAAIDNFLGKITKETEGRVTPADVELMRPSMPSFTDSPETAQQKLNTIKDQIKEKYSFPTLQTNRVLHPNDPRIVSSSTRQKRFTEGPPK